MGGGHDDRYSREGRGNRLHPGVVPGVVSETGDALSRRGAFLSALAAVPGLLAAPAVLAQTGERRPDEAAMTLEIMAMRDRLKEAARGRDRKALEGFYDDRFQHLRDTGRADPKHERITLLLAGEATIETEPEREVAVTAYSPDVAVAIGTTPIPDPAAKRPALFRWMALYVRDDGAWRIAMSQASRLRNAR